jgi:hypothetical protein
MHINNKSLFSGCQFLRIKKQRKEDKEKKKQSKAIIISSKCLNSRKQFISNTSAKDMVFVIMEMSLTFQTERTCVLE